MHHRTSKQLSHAISDGWILNLTVPESSLLLSHGLPIPEVFSMERTSPEASGLLAVAHLGRPWRRGGPTWRDTLRDTS